VNEIENWEVSDGPGRDRRTEEEHIPITGIPVPYGSKWEMEGRR